MALPPPPTPMKSSNRRPLYLLSRQQHQTCLQTPRTTKYPMCKLNNHLHSPHQRQHHPFIYLHKYPQLHLRNLQSPRQIPHTNYNPMIFTTRMAPHSPKNCILGNKTTDKIAKFCVDKPPPSISPPNPYCTYHPFLALQKSLQKTTHYTYQTPQPYIQKEYTCQFSQPSYPSIPIFSKMA